MNRLKYFVIPLLLLPIAGCTWQRIPAPPEYAREQPIPLRVGVIASSDPNSRLYIPGVVAELKSMRLFDSILYPYHEDDPVDAVTTLAVDGEWKPSGPGPVFVVGITLGLASPFVGPSVTGNHVIKATMISGTEDVGFYSSKVSTTAEWGVMADANEASQRTNALQTKRLAFALAQAVREDRNNLLAKVTPNAEEYPLAEAPVVRRPKASPRNPPPLSTPKTTPRRESVAENPPVFKQGLLSFEAERLAIQQGCTTANGIRPVALLVRESNNLGIYDVACQQGQMTIRCEYQNCEIDR